jgi:4-amino-4-deoxy-L-arabinose transferase-like glycosyltransferase
MTSTPDDNSSTLASADTVPPPADTIAVLEDPIAPSRPFFDRFTERQMVIFVLLIGALLYLPFAGSYGLFDPWETHYGEVGRQMARRNDFISLYWPGSPLDADNFWSKPVLTFWLMSLSMKVFGIGGSGLSAGAFALSSRPEWALRVPFCLMALLALLGVYLPVARFVSRRAGVLTVLALATFPLFSLVARQAMTDMAFIGPMTLGLGLCALALFDDKDDELPRRKWRGLSWPHHPIYYTTIGLLALTVLPQLIVNSIQLTWPLPFKRITIPGPVAMLPYFAGFFAFIWYTARTRFKAPFYLHIASILCGIAMLAKGLAGLGLPVIVFLAYLLFTWNWRRLARAQILRALPFAILACALVAVPWHHAMLVRHGFPFWNELYGDNHWRRLVTGRHGDRGSFEYFIRELGYGLFPWIALAPSALAWVAMRSFGQGSRHRVGVAGAPSQGSRHRVGVAGLCPAEPERARPSAASGEVGGGQGPRAWEPSQGSHNEDKRRDILWFGAIWFVAGYALVSFSMTKFHHYILPALPGLAIAIGCFLDDVLAEKRGRLILLAVLAGTPLLALTTFDLTSAQKSAQHFIWLFSYDYVNTPQGRPWPPDMNYVHTLWVFAGLFTIALGFIAWRRARTIATIATLGVAVAFTYFLLDVYIRTAASHWSQKPLIAQYYQERRSPNERLLAWQLYWRGENFYTQNEIYEGPMNERTVFLGDRNAENLKEYVAAHKGKRMFFIIERTRIDGLRGLLPESIRPSLKIANDDNNKFYLLTADL